MTDNNTWEPSDGAGYIPTEEGGNGRQESITEALERLEQEAQEIADNPERRQTQAYANGVCAGINYVVDELADLIEGQD